MDNYPLLNLFLTMLYLFLWIAWIMVVFRIIVDIFRSDDLGGWGKAGWMLLILVIPWLGALIYLIARGSGMYSRDAKQAEASRDAMATWIAQSPSAPATATPADQLAKLAELHQSGHLTDEEFAQQKAKVLA
ncbi:MAG: SHOCT domain-containing protein [Humibacillus sp.]|nr:SHOCT domain-containing protein [Humibacillus sp.]MDN5777368.1 SHOCT domain-containing protein [Humibacillus sp.]